MSSIDDAVSNEVADAVRAAINAGWDPTRFVRCAKDCWVEHLREAATLAEEDFVSSLQRPVR